MPDAVVKVRTAIFSLSDKAGSEEFARKLIEFHVDILATGGTFVILKEAGLAVKSLQEDMKLPTAVSGRVKTLHAPLHAAILAKGSTEHQAELKALGVAPVDMVVCNFYPFRNALRKLGPRDDGIVESIDIGGPTMVRAASKNFERVVVVPSPAHYGAVMEEMTRLEGGTSLEFRRRMAIDAFSITSSYDEAVYNGLRGGLVGGLPGKLLVAGSKVQDAKYGENPDRKAVIYSIDGWTTMADWKQLAGDTLSFNNYLDVGSAYDIVEGYDDPAVATVKHGQISGFAFAPTVAEAYSLAHSCDPEADFGGTVVTNRPVGPDAAKLIGKNEGTSDGSVYTEILMAPSFTADALAILMGKQKKKIRLIQTGTRPDFPYDLKVVEGAVLAQESPDYREKLDPAVITVPTKTKPGREHLDKLLAAWEVLRRVQSNGIVVAQGSFEDARLTRCWTLGVASYRKRNGATRIALENAGDRARGAVCASDGFFPFRDSVDLLAEAGVSAVIQPGGSANDPSSIQAADEHGIIMAFTHTRAFKH